MNSEKRMSLEHWLMFPMQSWGPAEGSLDAPGEQELNAITTVQKRASSASGIKEDEGPKDPEECHTGNGKDKYNT